MLPELVIQYFTTFQNLYLYTRLTAWAFKVDHGNIWLLRPISGLPYSWLFNTTMLRWCKLLLGQEQT